MLHTYNMIGANTANTKAFTLAEVMITLTVIGIITAVIVPVAINSKPDGSRIDSNINSDDATYLCKTIADNLTTKKVNCSKYLTQTDTLAFYCSDWDSFPDSTDEKCKQEAKNTGEGIVLSDGVVFTNFLPLLHSDTQESIPLSMAQKKLQTIHHFIAMKTKNEAKFIDVQK